MEEKKGVEKRKMEKGKGGGREGSETNGRKWKVEEAKEENGVKK